MDANAIIRQVIAETLLIFDIGLGLFILRYLRLEYCKRGWRGMRARVANQAAFAVLVHITGLGLIRLWTVIQFVMMKHGVDPSGVDDIYQIPSVGLFLAVLGMSCCIRVFSPVHWGNWGWVMTFLAAAGFVGYMQSLV